MSGLLIDDQPILFSPGMAIVFGVNEAIFLQQLHWWLGVSEHEIDGRKWTYNSADEWIATTLPHISAPTFRRMIAALETRGIVITRKLESSIGDHRKWYAIDYARFHEVVAASAPYQDYIGAVTQRRTSRRRFMGLRLKRLRER